MRDASAVTVLLRSELTRRRGTYALLFAVFFATTAGLSVLLGAVAGIEDSIGRGLRDTLTSDARLSVAKSDRLAEGPVFHNATAAAGRIAHALGGGARVVPRIEFDAILLHTSRYEDFKTGLVVGIDPARDGDVSRVAAYIVEGHAIDAENLWWNGTPYPQVLIGSDLLRDMNMTVFNGTLGPDNVLNVTAGRFGDENAKGFGPVVKESVVVGAYRTGFQPVDRGVLYVHKEVAKDLLRAQLEPDPATVLLVAAPPRVDVATPARAEGLEASSAEAFRESYLHAVFAPVRAFARLVAIVVLAIATGWATNVVVQSVVSDRKRLAVLRALGLPTGLLAAPIALALMIGALAGTIAGLALGALLAAGLGVAGFRAPGLGDLQFVATLPPTTALLLAVGVLAATAVGALGAGVAMRRISVTDALRR